MNHLSIRDRGSMLLLSTILAFAGHGCFMDTQREPSIRMVVSPAAAGSGMSNLAVGANGKLYSSWVEPSGGEGHSVRFATWEGDSWSEARTIVTRDDLFVNWADIPSMTALADGTLAAHWLGKIGPDAYAYAVYLVVSRDGGRTWSEPVHPHQDGTLTEHGFVSMLPASHDTFELIWLDGRETGVEGAQEGFVVQSGGAMTLRHATLSRDGTAGPEQLVDDRVCDCCPTDATRVTDGSLVVVYRDRTDTEIRDISVKRWDGEKWSPTKPVHTDRWEVLGCPVNGPAVAAVGDRVASAWFTMAGDGPKVYLAFSSDGGRSFGPPVRVDGGRPVGRVDLVLLEDGAALVSWIEETGGGSAEIRLRRVDSPKTLYPPFPVSPTTSSRASGLPRLARMGEEVFLTWTLTGQPSQIQTAVIPISPGH